MTTEELLKPRWKVIADFPLSIYEIGEIISQDPLCDTIPVLHSNVNPTNYPAIFQKLQWWENRTEDELPEYIHHKDYINDSIIKVAKYDFEDKIFYPFPKHYAWHFSLYDTSPSTKEEYENSK